MDDVCLFLIKTNVFMAHIGANRKEGRKDRYKNFPEVKKEKYKMNFEKRSS